jgi:SulP family sulfate permease
VAGWLPSLDRFTHHDRSWLRGDLLAGVTVAAYLIPQVMAYAEVAGLPAVTELWALVYAVIGASRQLSVGPESTTALMTAAAAGRWLLVTPPALPRWRPPSPSSWVCCAWPGAS